MELTDWIIGLKEVLDYHLPKLCEEGINIFEKDSLCQHPSDYCKYCKEEGDKYLCLKKHILRLRNQGLILFNP